MHLLLRFITKVVVLCGLVILHLGSSYLLPYPWHYLNVLFSFFLLFVFFTESGTVVWFAFFAHVFIELYTTTLYGVVLFAATMSTLIMYWLYQYLFTNRSWYSVLALSISTITLYRLIYSSLLWVATLFSSAGGSASVIPWTTLLRIYGWEVLLTSSLTTVVSIILFHFFHHTTRSSPVRY